MSKSRMTLHVYRIAADGTRTDLGRETIRAGEPYIGPHAAESEPCQCRNCCRKREETDPGAAA